MMMMMMMMMMMFLVLERAILPLRVLTQAKRVESEISL
jgi:hypothetical protein